MNETLQAIVDYVVAASPQAAQAAGGPASLAVHKVFDSIAMIDFLAFLERRFQIRISDADVLPQNFADFAAVARLVESKRQRA